MISLGCLGADGDPSVRSSGCGVTVRGDPAAGAASDGFGAYVKAAVSENEMILSR